MYGEQLGFKAFHKAVHLDKFIGLCYASLIVPRDKYINYTVWPTWPHNNRTNLYNFRGFCRNVGVLFSLACVAGARASSLFRPLLPSACYAGYFQLRNSTTGLREARTNSIPSLAISVLEYYKKKPEILLCHVSVYRVLSEGRGRDPISVAFFDQVALFSYFNRLFELLWPGFAIAAMPFIY